MHQKAYIALKAIIQDKDKLLILKKATSDQTNQLAGWETPGGRLEEGEDLMTGISREIQEETGLNVEILHPFHAFIANIGRDDCIIGVSYTALYQGDEVMLDKKEHSDYTWKTIKEIRELTESLGLQKEIDAFENFRMKIQS